jgi:N-acyl-D-amino-acid deacylase
MTAMSAGKMGIKGRGILKEGFFADIVIFDPETIKDRATFEDPHQYPDGIEYVIINGQIVAEHGTIVGTRPGRILKK